MFRKTRDVQRALFKISHEQWIISNIIQRNMINRFPDSDFVFINKFLETINEVLSEKNSWLSFVNIKIEINIIE